MEGTDQLPAGIPPDNKQNEEKVDNVVIGAGQMFQYYYSDAWNLERSTAKNGIEESINRVLSVMKPTNGRNIESVDLCGVAIENLAVLSTVLSHIRRLSPKRVYLGPVTEPYKGPSVIDALLEWMEKKVSQFTEIKLDLKDTTIQQMNKLLMIIRTNESCYVTLSSQFEKQLREKEKSYQEKMESYLYHIKSIAESTLNKSKRMDIKVENNEPIKVILKNGTCKEELIQHILKIYRELCVEQPTEEMLKEFTSQINGFLSFMLKSHDDYYVRYEKGISNLRFEPFSYGEWYSQDDVFQDKESSFLCGFHHPYWEDIPYLNELQGYGIRVAILDTGATACKINAPVHYQNFVDFPNSYACLDVDGHGTHLAGIIRSIAPECELLVGKVMLKQDTIEEEDLINGLEWAERKKADIVNLSLTCEYTPRLYQTIMRMLSNNIIIIAAVSNNGRTRRNPIGIPAQFGSLICVGASNEDGEGATFSAAGREVDCLADGVTIASELPYQLIDKETGKWICSKFTLQDGVSQATAAVSGLAALLLQFDQQMAKETGGEPCLTNTFDVKRLLREMSASPGYHHDHRGYGILEPERVFKISKEYSYNLLRDAIGLEPVFAKREPANNEIICSFNCTE